MRSEVDGILVAAYELKAPLVALRQLALTLDKVSIKDEKIRLQMIRVSEKAIKQINDLAKIRKLEGGLFKMEPVAVREVCDSVLNEILSFFHYNEGNLRVRYTNRSKLVSANRELLSSVVYNFLFNAMYYSNEGLKTELSVCERGGRVKISIRDFGPAIPIKIWKNIKNNSIGNPTSIAMRPNSSGLSLYIAAKFSKYMNAELGVVRHRDGVSFFVELPISKQMSLF